MVVRRLKSGKDWQKLPGGLTGTGLGPRLNEPKNKKNTKPPKRGAKSE